MPYPLHPIKFPAIALVASGGHTELFYMKDAKTIQWLGGTLDDAAGECFDKVAKLLGLPYPGGPAIAHAALNYSSSDEQKRGFEKLNSSQLRSNNIKLPRPMMYEDSLNFSFSGLKTAVIREVQKLKNGNQWSETLIEQLAYEVQEAITDVLVHKTIRAAQQNGVKSILISGGVAANTRLREKFNHQLQTTNYKLIAPAAQLCTDNAAAIAACAYFQSKPADWKSITAQPNLSVQQIQ